MRAKERGDWYYISIHAPREGSDKLCDSLSCFFRNFNPRSPWRERRTRCDCRCKYRKISIHAPREGSDNKPFLVFQGIINFNPRSPWRERPVGFVNPNDQPHFNPRSPWRERRRTGNGCDISDGFQSTLPVKGATVLEDIIHTAFCYFNPRSPWRERQVIGKHDGSLRSFQSTLPVKGATLTSRYISYIARAFQSTLPVKGATVADFNSFPPFSNFNPRSPWRERRLSISLPGSPRPISIHAPREGSDSNVD